MYATLEPKRRKRKTKQGIPDTRGRKPVTEQVKIVSLGRDLQRVRFVLSEDIVEKLIALYEEDYATFVFHKGPLSERYKPLRLQFAPFVNIAIPAVLLRIEPPTTDPRGHRMWRPKGSRQFITEILAAKLRIKPGIATQTLDHFWADLPGGRLQLHGLIVNFADADMIFPGGKEKPDKYQINVNNFVVQ